MTNTKQLCKQQVTLEARRIEEAEPCLVSAGWGLCGAVLLS